VTNPYFIDEPSIISFSGGRTSAYMLWRVLQAHDGVLPDCVKVLFANTGKEMPETLDFVRNCGEQWGVDIVWLERSVRSEVDETKKYGKTYKYETKVVNYETASRSGEPFAQLIAARAYAPNAVARFCTVDLKIRAIEQYCVQFEDFEDGWQALIGIRADEERRAAKMHGTKEGKQDRFLPLWLDGVTRFDVSDFWNAQNFDLGLPNIGGTTPFGNCDLCFLKGHTRKLSIIRERPDLADWWIEQEASLSKQVGSAAYFRADQPSYATMKMIATDQGNLFDKFDDDDSMSCFCGD